MKKAVKKINYEYLYLKRMEGGFTEKSNINGTN